MKSILAQIKDNELLNKSSSGGIFSMLANYVLSMDGIVFGCTIERVEDGFNVKHIYIDDKKDLFKLLGSKYVQSNLGNSIKQAKEFLDKGKFVLFSGTPCQIAGLKSFLKNDYENLITVDFSCTGTPPLKIFNDFIKILERKYKKKIVKFEFRNKEKLGWSCGNALITLENGKQKILYNNICSYMNLFMHKLIQGNKCNNCKYVGLNRVSDITLADAWGIEYEEPKFLDTLDKKKGVSLVLINSNKGLNYFDILNNNIIYKEVFAETFCKYNAPLCENNKNIQYNKEYEKVYAKKGYNAVNQLFKKNIGKKYYYYVLKNNTPKIIKNIIKNVLPKKTQTDCLLYTMYNYPNYGSILTAWALQQFIEELGFKNKVIHHSNLYGFNLNFAKKHMKLTNRCVSLKDFSNLNNYSKIFIVGSDNLINLETNGINFVSSALLNFTDEQQKRLMISGSIGNWDGKTKNQQEYEYIKYLFKRFDYISTREEYGKTVLEKIFDCKADWINDPIFYIKKEKFIDITKNVKQNYSGKIMQYILYPSKKTQQIVDIFNEKEIVKFEGNKHCVNKNKSVEHWLSAIINSDLIITDSFHCVAFALIFNKQFICIKNTHATVRFLSLFKKLGISIPLIDSVYDLQNSKLSYDVQKVNEQLAEIRKFAVLKISENLLKPKQNLLFDDEMMSYNNNFIKQNIPWYKKNKIFYFCIVVPVVNPIIKIFKNLMEKEHE